MVKNPFFDYAAIMVEFILLACIILKRMTGGKLNRIFTFLIATSLLTTTMDVLAVSFDSRGTGFLAEKIIFHTCYLFLRSLASFLYVNYIIVLTDTWYQAVRNRLKQILFFLPVAVTASMMLVNLITHNVFWFDENDAYTRGPFFIILYIETFYYLIFGTYTLLKNNKFIETEKIVSFFVGVFFLLAAALAQFLVPALLVDMFSMACALLFLFMMVHRPEELVDPETGLIRTTAYVRDMNRSLSYKKPETVIMVNLVDFGVLKEMLGYSGILALKKVIAMEILSCLKPVLSGTDVYYIGGGAYRIRCNNNKPENVAAAANALNELFKEKTVYGDTEISIDACVCILHLPEDISSPEALSAFEEGLSDEYTGNVLLGSDICKKVRYDLVREMDLIIETALSEREFRIYYQPIWSVKEKRFISAEALVRLQSKKYGWISPELFIPAAERSGTINRLGKYILENVCEFIKSEDFSRLGLEFIEVNLSPVQCYDDNIAKMVTGILEKYDVPPSRINLEITETAASEHQLAVFGNIKKLNEAGIGLSLDDFGTGYSNMTRIASLPFSIIKLDKSLTDLKQNPNLSIVVENLVKMIKSLGKTIVVEGIEDKETVEVFDRLGCEYVQGYYYSKPLPQDELIRFIGDKK